MALQVISWNLFTYLESEFFHLIMVIPGRKYLHVYWEGCDRGKNCTVGKICGLVESIKSLCNQKRPGLSMNKVTGSVLVQILNPRNGRQPNKTCTDLVIGHDKVPT